jgi:hypothetical protein
MILDQTPKKSQFGNFLKPDGKTNTTINVFSRKKE